MWFLYALVMGLGLNQLSHQNMYTKWSDLIEIFFECLTCLTSLMNILIELYALFKCTYGTVSFA